MNEQLEAGSPVPQGWHRLGPGALAFVDLLIWDAEQTAEDVARVLGPDNEAAPGLKGARDYLRAVRDTAMLCTRHLTPEARELLGMRAIEVTADE